MFFALLLLLLMTAGGFAATYLYDEDAGFVVRAASGAVIGQILFSLAGFALGCAFGMSFGVLAAAAIFSALPLILFSRPGYANAARGDFQNSVDAVKNFARRPTVWQASWAVVYAALLIFLWFFFERAMLNVEGGIGTGNVHNTGDISFHLQAIYGFLDGQNYPPQNPSLAGGKFTYPFMVDLTTAMLATTGALISAAQFWQNMFLIVALVVVMRHFTLKLTGDPFAANVAPLILLLSGGLGFILFFRDAVGSEAGVFSYLFKMSHDYTIRGDSPLRWGNTLTVLYMNQRSMLLGMPLALIVLGKVWEIFTARAGVEEGEKGRKGEGEKMDAPQPLSSSPFLPFSPSLFTIGLLAGTLPLVHAHSFAAVMGMSALLALMSLKRWREWFVFFAAAAIVSVPELLWAMLGSASKAKSFIDWHYGWDNNGKIGFFGFWFLNTGLFIPLLIAALIWLIIKARQPETVDETADKNSAFRTPHSALVLFWLPFALCFIVPNIFRLTPWVWDNIKVLIYWFVASVPLVAWLLAQIWRRGAGAGKTAAIALLIVLTLSGFLDVWRIASRQQEWTVFDRDTVLMAHRARQILPPDAVVASAPIHSSPAAILGRRWFLGFTGHLWSHGIDPDPRVSVLRQIYTGKPNAKQLLAENKIQFLVLSQHEREYFQTVNEEFMRQFTIVAQAGDYQLLKVSE